MYEDMRFIAMITLLPFNKLNEALRLAYYFKFLGNNV